MLLKLKLTSISVSTDMWKVYIEGKTCHKSVISITIKCHSDVEADPMMEIADNKIGFYINIKLPNYSKIV